jgi:DNA polymerase-4
LQEWLPKLLARTEAGLKPVRLVGLSLSGFELPVVDEKGQAQLDLLLNDVF